jgi:hypothetical protein
MLFNEIIVVYSENCKELINTLRDRNSRYVVKVGGAHSLFITRF